MQIEVPYDYINLLAFLNVMKYENNRSIKVKDLNNYRVALLDKVLEEYKDPDMTFMADEDQWKGEVTFSYVDEKKALRNFLHTYNHILYLDGDTIYLNDDVDYKILNHELIKLKREEEIGHRFGAASSRKDLLKVLGIKKIETFLKGFLKVEEETEVCYMDLFSSKIKDSERIMKKNLLMRALLLNNLKNSESQYVDAFRLVAADLYYDKDSYEYDIYPLSMDLWVNSEFYNSDKDELFNNIDDRLYEIYQYAIFGDDSLSLQKLWDMIDNLYFFEMPVEVENLLFNDSDDDSDEYDEEEDYGDEEYSTYDAETEDIDMEEGDKEGYFICDSALEDNIFYLNYVDKLNKYMVEYGEDKELLRVKKRLLYVLDNPTIALYKEENFENELLKIQAEEIKNDSFDFIEDEIRFMASEVFLVPEDKNTVKKLLFVSTYYDLTGDESVKEIMGRYSNHEKFNLYSKITFGKQKGKTKVKSDNN